MEIEERRARLENDAATKRQVDHGDGRRKKSKTGEDGSYHTAHVSPDLRCGQCGCGFVPQTHS